ncbi:Signal recognition particle, SRP9 subunit [Ascosphaera apis ARSEF 7405]|uniref:Signal recognition particle, SRP9 subunit n=1 Tax=Ascosphaera apis ARSEF 7405 TaxID=392613 RepID=A0A167ZT64_9EURO|nr:Signal recognition particle, SRP9 subunit [Ascosphaera apis ARSEF 7405]
MPYFTTSQEYLSQSSLLLQAYPDARITTKYSYPKHKKPSKKNPSSSKDGDVIMSDAAPPQPSSTTTTATTTAETEDAAPATLTLKTYHPTSGICLKYKTDKAAEIGRLVSGLALLAAGKDVSSLDAGAAAVAAAEAEEEEVGSAAASIKEEKKDDGKGNTGAGAGTGKGKSGGKKKGRK